MSTTQLQDYLHDLSDRYRWRDIKKLACFLGVHRGIYVVASEREGVIFLKFFSPGADLRQQIAAHFAGFHHCEEGGLPLSWLEVSQERDKRGRESPSVHGCLLRIDSGRLEQIGEKRLLELPDLVASDLQEQGAPDSIPCQKCREKPSEILSLIDGALTAFCGACWSEVESQAPSGKLFKGHGVRWRRTLPALFACTVAGALIWGYLQQPDRLDRFGLLSILFPVGWALAVCCVVGSLSPGVTRSLRLSIFASVVLTVLAGNTWGFRSFLVQRMEQQLNRPVAPPDWFETVRLYFSALPQISKSEAPFFLGGIIGAWIGLRLLKREEYVEIH